MTITHDDFRTAAPDTRVQLIENLLVTTVLGFRPGTPAWFDGNTRLPDLAIDSLQLVELKFALEQLIGDEIDVGLLIVDPTVHQLAVTMAALGPS